MTPPRVPPNAPYCTKAFDSGWREQKLSPALWELQELICLLTSKLLSPARETCFSHLCQPVFSQKLGRPLSRSTEPTVCTAPSSLAPNLQILAALVSISSDLCLLQTARLCLVFLSLPCGPETTPEQYDLYFPFFLRSQLCIA